MIRVLKTDSSENKIRLRELDLDVCLFALWGWVYTQQGRTRQQKISKIITHNNLIPSIYSSIAMASQSFRNFLTVTYIITGSLSYYTSKFQNIQRVHEGDIQKNFFHPYIQSFTMFFGEFLCLLVFWALSSRNPAKFEQDKALAVSQGKSLEMNKFILMLPAAFDFLSSMLQYFAMNFIPGSIYQMLKGGSLITTFFFSWLLIRSPIKRSQISGCVLAFIGVTIVGTGNLLFGKSSSKDSNLETQILGYGLMLLSLIFNGFFYAYEQKLFKQYYLAPLQAVGFEGIFGMIYCLIAIPILTFIPCPFNGNIAKSACVFTDDSVGYLERPEMFFKEFAGNAWLIVMVPLGIIAVGTFNMNGMSITKHINALARSLLNMTKTVFIWGIGIIVTLTIGSHDDRYKWEVLNTGALVLEAIGFVFLVLATLIYNQNIYIPYLSDSKQESLLQVSSKDSILDSES